MRNLKTSDTYLLSCQHFNEICALQPNPDLTKAQGYRRMKIRKRKQLQKEKELQAKRIASPRGLGGGEIRKPH
jgi:hypothetical protein